MGTAIDFPYNQTVQAFAPTAGTYKDVTFVISNTSNGLGGGQLQPTGTNADSNSVNYQSPIPFPYDIDANGSSNSALCFVLNPQAGWINQDPPYYFVSGSTGKNIWLYTLTPAAAGEDFTSANLVCQGKIGTMDSAIASLYYYASLNLLFVAGDNGDIFTYTVTWSSTGVPTFTSQGGNSNYDSPTGCAVSFCFFYNSLLTPNASSTTNQFGQFVPAGSYQESSTGISITLSAQCLNAQGQAVASTLTFTAAQAASIAEIYNDNGKLTLASGSNSSANVYNQFGQYVPAGSYQETSSDIMVTITATCALPDGTTASSSLVYSAEVASTIVSIINNNGQLVLTTPVFLIVSGLTLNNQNGSFYFPLSTANNGVLPNALGMLGSVENTVATVVDQQNQTIYIASQTEVVAQAFNNLQGTGTTIWNAANNNLLILSMAGIANPQGYTYEGNFGNGALVVGTVPNSSSATNTTPGSLYALDSNTGYSYTLANGTLSGSPYSLFADANYHLLVNYGATGLDLYTLPASGNSPQPISLIPNVNDTSTGWMHWLVEGLVLFAVIVVVGVLTDGTGDAAVVTDVVGDGVADSAADGSADAAGNVAADGGGDATSASEAGDDFDPNNFGNTPDPTVVNNPTPPLSIYDLQSSFDNEGELDLMDGDEELQIQLRQDSGGTSFVSDGNSEPYYVTNSQIILPNDLSASSIANFKSAMF